MLKDIFFKLVENLGMEIGTVIGEDNRENYQFRINGEHASYLGACLCLEEEQLFVANINTGIKIPEDKIPEASAYILKQDYDYMFGFMYITPETRIVEVRSIFRMTGDEKEKYNFMNAALYQVGAIADKEYKKLLEFVVE